MPTSSLRARTTPRTPDMVPYSARVSRVLLVIFFLAVFGYGLFEARGIVLGPRIEIDETPLEVSEQYVRIQGAATHIATLTMNGAAIPVTEEGVFDEPFLLHMGENVIRFQAADKYGNTTEKTVTIIYAPVTPAVPPAEVATTTPAEQPVAPAP